MTDGDQVLSRVNGKTWKKRKLPANREPDQLLPIQSQGEKLGSRWVKRRRQEQVEKALIDEIKQQRQETLKKRQEKGRMLREKKQKKQEKERLERFQQTMSKKRLERLKKRRNKVEKINTESLLPPTLIKS